MLIVPIIILISIREKMLGKLFFLDSDSFEILVKSICPGCILGVCNKDNNLDGPPPNKSKFSKVLSKMSQKMGCCCPAIDITMFLEEIT